MPGEQILLDPTGEATGTQLDITDATLGYQLLEHDYPVPDVDVVQAGSIDTEGANPAAGKHQPRTITAKIRVAQLADASVNLVTNPSAETGVAGWLDNASGTAPGNLTRITSWKAAGSYAFRYAATTGVGSTFPGFESDEMAAVAGTTYSARVTLKATTYPTGAANQMIALLRFFDAAHGALGDTSAGTVAGTSEGTTTTSGAAPVNTAFMRLIVYTMSTASSAVDIAMDAAIVTASTSASDYFDGDSPGALWTGTRHASTSARSVTTQVAILQRKIGKLFREGGTYRRVLPSGEQITFDVQRFGARIQVPADKRWITRGTADVTITLTCKPYGRGAEVDLGDNVETTLPVLVFTETGIKGDMTALGRLVVDNDGAAVKSIVIWGLESRNYSSASTASLFFEAEDMGGLAPLNAGVAGASGGGASKVRRMGAIPNNTVVLTTPTHVGTFRVFARVQVAAAAPAAGEVTLQWAPAVAAAVTSNSAVPIEDQSGVAIKGAWVVVDLGLVTIPRAKAGSQGWTALLAGNQQTIDVDWIALVPTESSGQMGGAGAGGSASLSTGDSLQVRHDGVIASSSGSWYDAPYEGDYLRVPPSGAEGRTARVIVLALGGPAYAGNSNPLVISDPSIEDISARLYVTPRYLVVPEP